MIKHGMAVTSHSVYLLVSILPSSPSKRPSNNRSLFRMVTGLIESGFQLSLKNALISVFRNLGCVAGRKLSV